MENKKIGHHYIPNSSYLKNFTDNSGKVWVLDGNDRIYGTNPANIFKENNFYTITLKKGGGGSLIVENTLANIESAYANIFREKIAKNLPLSDQERATISFFLAALYLRTKSKREELRKGFKNLQNQLTKIKSMFENNEQARRVSAPIPSDSGDIIFTMSDLAKLNEDLNELHTISIAETLPQIAQIIFDMKWCFLKIKNTNDVFLSSDNPFRILRPESIKKYGPCALGSVPGFQYNDAEITFPLSSKIALLGGWKMNRNETLEPEKEMINEINRRSIMYANEKVIADNRKILEWILQNTPKHI